MAKLLILTASKDTLSWPSLPNKLAEIKLALNSGKNADWLVDIQYKSAQPIVKDERISHDWLESHFKDFYQDYDIVAFHYSYKQKAAWGVQPSLRGANPNRKDTYSDLYFWSDEDTKRKGLSQFVETCLHEIAHEVFQQTKTKDITHEYHDSHDSIFGLYKTFDWSKFKPRITKQKKTINVLKRLVWLYRGILAKKTPTGTKPQVKPNFEPPKDLLPLVKRKVDAFVKDAELFGLPIRITEGFRSFERQNELYAQGRTKSGNIVTNAKGGQSNHNYGCAIDIVFRKLGYDASNDQWLALASIAERHGFEWGGDWNEFVDKPHFEMTLGYTLSDFQNKKVDYNKFN